MAERDSAPRLRSTEFFKGTVETFKENVEQWLKHWELAGCAVTRNYDLQIPYVRVMWTDREIGVTMWYHYDKPFPWQVEIYKRPFFSATFRTYEEAETWASECMRELAST